MLIYWSILEEKWDLIDRKRSNYSTILLLRHVSFFPFDNRHIWIRWNLDIFINGILWLKISNQNFLKHFNIDGSTELLWRPSSRGDICLFSRLRSWVSPTRENHCLVMFYFLFSGFRDSNLRFRKFLENFFTKWCYVTLSCYLIYSRQNG